MDQGVPGAAATGATRKPTISSITQPREQEQPPAQALPSHLKSQDEWKTSDGAAHGETVRDRTQGEEQRSE